MLKSRALILSDSNGDNESCAPCWCQQTDRQTDHTQGHNLSAVIHLFFQRSLFKLLLILFQPRLFSSSPPVPRGHRPLPLLIFLLHLLLRLSLAALFLLHSLPPTRHRTHTYPPHTDIDKWRLTEMTASLLMFSSNTT